MRGKGPRNKGDTPLHKVLVWGQTCPQEVRCPAKAHSIRARSQCEYDREKNAYDRCKTCTAWRSDEDREG